MSKKKRNNKKRHRIKRNKISKENMATPNYSSKAVERFVKNICDLQSKRKDRCIVCILLILFDTANLQFKKFISDKIGSSDREELKKRNIKRSHEFFHCLTDCLIKLHLFYYILFSAFAVLVIIVLNHLFSQTNWIDALVRSLTLFSVITAIVQWQVNNRQSAMSEMFERKRETNLFIITHKKETQPLVSGALKARDATINSISDLPPDGCRVWLNYFINDTSKSRATFVQQMYVYLELDNLEFALNKYQSGYLNDEEMFRACEIFESRCQSDFFRSLSANGGLVYYTESFQDLVCVCLINGYLRSGGSLKVQESDNKNPSSI